MASSSGNDTKAPVSSIKITLFSAGLIAVILVNAYLIWYFLAGMPSACAARALETFGRETCGAGPAVPVILVLNVALIIASLYLLWYWHTYKRVER